MFDANLDEITLQDIEDFLVIGSGSEPVEGLSIDYKRQPSRDIVKAVVAFSNTGGGLVFIGVDEVNNIPTGIPGFQPPGRTDAKTHISNLIRQSTDPRIDFSVGAVTASSGDSVAVVRVEPSPHPPHMLTQGGQNRILVRVNDESLPADLRQVESLFARRGSALTLDERGQVPGVVDFCAHDRRAGDGSNLRPAGDSLRVWVRPFYPLNLRVDRRLEDAFLAEVIRCGQARPVIHRRKRWDAELLWRNDKTDIEQRWRIQSDGAVGFVAHAGDAPTKSDGGERRIHLPELIADTWVALAVATRTFREIGYDGPVEVRLWFSLANLEVVVTTPFPRFDVDQIRGVTGVSTITDHLSRYVYQSRSNRLCDSSDSISDAWFYALRQCRGADIEFDAFKSSVEQVRQGARSHCGL